MKGSERANNRHSPLLARYVGCEVAVPFVLCLVGLLGLFVVADALDAQRQLARAGADWRHTALYLLMRQPGNLVHVLPMTVLLAVSFTVSTMARRHEITAVRSSGVSLYQFGVPFWIVGALAGVATFALAEWMAPDVSERVRALRSGTEIERGATHTEQRLLAFRNRKKNRDWFFERYRADGTAKRVLVRQYAPDGVLAWELRAAAARYQGGSWSFRDAVVIHYRYQDGFPRPVDKQIHAEYSDPALVEPPATVTGTLKPTDDLSVRDMAEVLQQGEALPDRTRDILSTSIWYRFAYPWTCVMCALTGVGTNVRSERAGALAGFAAGVGIIFLFHMVSEFSVLFGRTGRLPAVVAGVGPVAAFTVWALRRVHVNR